MGVLSTYNTTGTYTWSLTSNPGGLFSISGSNLNVAAALTVGSKPITVQASGGVPTPLTQTFNIIVSLFVPNNYSLTAGMGSFLFTGEDMTPIAGYAMAAQAGAFALVDPGTTQLTPPPSADAAETTAFLARTTGLDVGHIAAYKELINGLVTDGIWSNFDAIYIIATQSVGSDGMTNARLNLVQNAYNFTAGTGAIFTPDRGVIDNFALIDTGFAPSVAAGVGAKFALNDAHLSVWANGAGGNNTDVGWGNGGPTSYIGMSASNGWTGINQADQTFMGTNPTGAGLFWGQRKNSGGAGALEAFTAAPNTGTILVVGTGSAASTSLTTGSIAIGSVPGFNYGNHQISAASIGKSMSATNIQKYYLRLQAYMTAVHN